MRITRLTYLLAAAALGAGLILLLSGCGGGGGSIGGGGASVGVFLTDAPPSAGITAVFVHVTAVEAIKQGGGIITLLSGSQIPQGGEINLVSLASTPLLLGRPLIPPGSYTQIRLILSTTAGDNYIVLTDGSKHDLTIPSGAETGAKMTTGPFTVTSGQATTILIDFNAAASVHQAGASGKWIMRPTIFASVVAAGSLQVGSIQGTVNNSSGVVIVPPSGELLGVFVQGPLGPVAVAEVSSTDGTYDIPTLLAGTYNLELSLADEDFNPLGSLLTFSLNGGADATSQPVTVTAGATTTANMVTSP